jgi:hypothetical protein
LSQVASYRSYRQLWSGALPATAPKLVAKRATASKTKVYVSWNGATDYDAWTIFAGCAHSSSVVAANLTVVARSVPRTGFETEYDIDPRWKCVLAQAKQAGRALRNTPIVSF